MGLRGWVRVRVVVIYIVPLIKPIRLQTLRSMFRNGSCHVRFLLTFICIFFLKKLKRKKNTNCVNKHDKTTHVAKKLRFERLDVSYVTTYIFRSES